MVQILRTNYLRKSISLFRQVGLYSLFILFERLLPAKNNYWCFCTWPGQYAHTMDNPRAVFEEVKNDKSIVKIVLRKRGQVSSSAASEGVNIIFVDAESILGAYFLSISKVVLLGYALIGLTSYSRFLTRKHHIVQLWHGVPLKRIGKLFPGEKHWDRETAKYAAIVCSSEPDRDVMSAAFSPVSKENVWMSGLPRNSLILKPEIHLPIDYRKELDRLRERLSGRRFVLYAPTWRDGENGIYDFSAEEICTLEKLLDKHNAVFGIRAHANRRVEDSGSRKGPLMFVNDFPDVNMLLRVADILITDYSSIYIDFLLTDKPILFFTYDIDRYISERGFLYKLTDAMTGAWFTTFDELVMRLESALENGVDEKEQYLRVRSLFHAHDNKSAQTVADKIRGLVSA